MHVEQQMAVKRPVARGVGRKVEGYLATRQHVDGVLQGVVAGMAVDQFEEMPVQMDRVLHHGIVDQGHAHTLVACKPDRLDHLAELAAIERPHETFPVRSEEHTSELQSLMRISYAVFCVKIQLKQSLILNTLS